MRRLLDFSPLGPARHRHPSTAVNEPIIVINIKLIETLSNDGIIGL
jgi:hypothetical protein